MEGKRERQVGKTTDNPTKEPMERRMLGSSAAGSGKGLGLGRPLSKQRTPC